MKEKLLTFFKKETILCIACLLAALSAYIVPPDAAYLGYVDTRVLILLFSLMAVLAGFRALGIFDRMANLLLAKAKKNAAASADPSHAVLFLRNACDQ